MFFYHHSSLLDLKKEDVDLDEQLFIIRKSKTEAGIRKIPIADKLLPFFKSWIEYSNSEYVFVTPNQEHLLHRNYLDAYFKPYINLYNMDLTPHCCRHTFISLMARQNISPTIIKMIVGHKRAMSITESIYTHFDVKTLIDAVNQICK